jgi:putative copper export protein
MPDAITILALSRGLHLAAALSLLGNTAFMRWVLPAASAVPEALRRRLIRIWWVSGIVSLLAGMVWFTLQAAVIADADNMSQVLDALPVVALHTRFGNMLLVRWGLLFGATLMGLRATRSPNRRIEAAIGAALTGAALGLQGFIGHAGATPGPTGDSLVLSEALHVLAAGLWLGALLPLLLCLQTLSPTGATAVCERFSPIGLACVLILAGTGFAQGLELIGGMAGLFGTPYGHIALLKIALFLLALVLAAVNRLWLTDRLSDETTGAKRHLSMSVCVETIIGLTIVTAAASLASVVPGVHQTPVWPLSWPFSLGTVNQDAQFHQQFAFSLITVGAAVALLVAALLARRFRLLATAVLAATVLWRGPTLSPLPIRAAPTTSLTAPVRSPASFLVGVIASTADRQHLRPSY